ECKGNVDVAPGRANVGREALVILHVARTLHVVRVVVALELREDDLRGLADDVDENVQAPSVRHADHDLLDTGDTALLDEIVEHRDEAVAAFQREALLRRVLRCEVELEPFRRRQKAQQRLARLEREAMAHATVEKAILQPEPFGRIRNVRELSADRSAEDLAELRDDVAQLHALRNRIRAAAGEEFRIEIRLAQPEMT